MKTLAAKDGKNILVLGGTNFLGPAFVSAAVAAGDKVTLFNRGITNPGLFPQLEKIRGNRSAEKAQQNLSGLAGREWDVVVDVWPHDPVVVESAAVMLGRHTKHYLYVSSVAAYDGYPKAGMVETDPISGWSSSGDYGRDKAESERRLNALLGGKLTVVRPGPIKGERDDTPDLFAWLMRARSGGTHIAPGDGSDPVELVDVKDVGGFLALAIGPRLLGTFNLTGRSMTFRAFLARCKASIHSNAEFLWIPREFLSREGLKNDRELRTFAGNFPFWRPDPDARGLYQISSEKAFHSGWRTRPLSETARDCIAFMSADWKDYLPAERERQVLADWARRA